MLWSIAPRPSNSPAAASPAQEPNPRQQCTFAQDIVSQGECEVCAMRGRCVATQWISSIIAGGAVVAVAIQGSARHAHGAPRVQSSEQISNREGVWAARTVDAVIRAEGHV